MSGERLFPHHIPSHSTVTIVQRRIGHSCSAIFVDGALQGPLDYRGMALPVPAVEELLLLLLEASSDVEVRIAQGGSSWP